MRNFLLIIRPNISILIVAMSLFVFNLSKAFAQDKQAEEVKPQPIYIPEGFVETKDLVYFDVEHQGAKGTIEKVISDYNNRVLGSKRYPWVTKKITTTSEIVTKDNKPLDWKYRMDIVHPIKPSKPRPVFFIVSTLQTHNFPRYTPFQQIFAKRGYVTVIIDHAYSPLDRSMGNSAAHFSMDDINGVKAYTAAIRYLRANAEKYSIDPDNVGGLGHSKGSYAIALLSDPKISASSPEYSGTGEAMSPQPNTDYPSNIQVGYQSMGNGTRRSRNLVKDDYAPTITAVGKFDKYNQWGAWPNVVKAYKEDRDANWLGIPMLDKAHEMAVGLQPDLGYVREEAVEKFFSSYLELNLPPNVLYVTPFNGYNKENAVKPNQPVVVHFSPQMDVSSVKSAVKIINTEDDKEVTGNWKVMRKDTYFIFTPSTGALDGKNYKVIIETHAKSKNGIALSKPYEHDFTIYEK